MFYNNKERPKKGMTAVHRTQREIELERAAELGSLVVVFGLDKGNIINKQKSEVQELTLTVAQYGQKRKGIDHWNCSTVRISTVQI